jgi:hypothetical protein
MSAVVTILSVYCSTVVALAATENSLKRKPTVKRKETKKTNLRGREREREREDVS